MTEPTILLEENRTRKSSVPHANAETNYLFEKLSDLELHLIINHMDPESRVNLASTSKQASAFMNECVRLENRLITEALQGLPDAADYDLDYSDSSMGVNRPLSVYSFTAVHLAAQDGRVSQSK
jgi:hypothetical protein